MNEDTVGRIALNVDSTKYIRDSSKDKGTNVIGVESGALQFLSVSRPIAFQTQLCILS